MKVSDYIVKKLEEIGVRHAFMISGGGAMHLNDAIGHSQKIKYVCNHNEQACAIAAEGYARYKYDLGVSIVTSGPGGTNTLTGVIGQWLDSIPALYLSGQVKFETTIDSCPELGLRQLGDQELNITHVVRPITKYAKLLTNPTDVRKELEKAIYLATHNRPGPVWLDIPLNVQGAMIDENNLEAWDGKLPEKEKAAEEQLKYESGQKIDQLISLLNEAKRPVIIAGHGIKIAKARSEFTQLINKSNIPVVTTFNGYDLISFDHSSFVGRIGTLGTRAGNFALQNSDLIISIGSRNNVRQVSYNWEHYARDAKQVYIDIDKSELSKKTLNAHLTIHSDAKSFLMKLNEQIANVNTGQFDEWQQWCSTRKSKYSPVLPEYKKLQDRVHPYYFMQFLTRHTDASTPIVAANGSACVTLFQAGEPKENQSIFWNSGCASMGYALPASIGAAFASGKDVVCITGDGSIMMNLQELQTISHYKLPIKIFLLGNEGYQSIKQTQSNFFNGHLVACTPETGVTFPDFSKLADAHGIPYYSIKNHDDMENSIDSILNKSGPLFCEVFLDTKYIFSPKVSSKKLANGKIISKPLEDMFPFLERDEFLENMIVPPLIEEDE